MKHRNKNNIKIKDENRNLDLMASMNSLKLFLKLKETNRKQKSFIHNKNGYPDTQKKDPLARGNLNPLSKSVLKKKSLTNKRSKDEFSCS